ncbi:MAG: RHS repeat-associated core domain-containing protein [Pirellulales bacterium]
MYDGDDVLLDFVDPDGAGPQPLALAARYLHGPAVDQVLAQEDVATGEVLWQLADNLGTSRDLVDSDGVLVHHLVYEAFGALTSGDPTATRYQFTGREWDADLGLYYYRARWYDPQTGRFISEDPIGFEGGDANLNRYVGNDPANFTDPSGLVERDENGMITGIVPGQTFGPKDLYNDKDIPLLLRLAIERRYRIRYIGNGKYLISNPDGSVTDSTGPKSSEEVINQRKRERDTHRFNDKVLGAVETVCEKGAALGTAADTGLVASGVGAPVVAGKQALKKGLQRAAKGLAGKRGASDGLEQGAKRATTRSSKDVPNPHGKLGSPAHRKKVQEVADDIRSRGLEPDFEVPVKTVNGKKNTRCMDVVARDPETGRIVEVHQVGRTLKTKPKVPVSRERDALRDVRNSPDVRGAKRHFHEY